MTMGIPQIIAICLIFLGVGISMARYGKPKDDIYDMVDILIAPAIWVVLLYWGGFFG